MKRDQYNRELVKVTDKKDGTGVHVLGPHIQAVFHDQAVNILFCTKCSNNSTVSTPTTKVWGKGPYFIGPISRYFWWTSCKTASKLASNSSCNAVLNLQWGNHQWLWVAIWQVMSRGCNTTSTKATAYKGGSGIPDGWIDPSTLLDLPWEEMGHRVGACSLLQDYSWPHGCIQVALIGDLLENRDPHISRFR